MPYGTSKPCVPDMGGSLCATNFAPVIALDTDAQ